MTVLCAMRGDLYTANPKYEDFFERAEGLFLKVLRGERLNPKLWADPEGAFVQFTGTEEMCKKWLMNLFSSLNGRSKSIVKNVAGKRQRSDE